jgi:hypothetical protein
MFSLFSNELMTLSILVCIGSFLVSYFFYFLQKDRVSGGSKWLLIFLRGIILSMITLLFLPFIFSKNVDEELKTKQILLLDESLSTQKLSEYQELKTTLTDWQNKQSKNYDILQFNFSDKLYNGSVKNIHSTNLSAAINEIQNQYDAEEINSVILVSDGIYNQSYDPKWLQPQPLFPINTVGIGDSNIYPDVKVVEVFHNPKAFKGNSFIIQTDINCQEVSGKEVQVQLFENGKNIKNKSFAVSSNDHFKSLQFEVEAKKEGLHQYKIVIPAFDNELNKNNNIYKTVVNVVDVKQKVALLNFEIHPDFSLFKKSLANNLDIQLSPFNKDFSTIDLSLYNSFIINGYQPEYSSLVKEIMKSKKPVIFQLHSTSDNNQLIKDFPKTFTKPQNITTKTWENSQVYLSPNFSGFDINSEFKQHWSKFPPLKVPFQPVSLLGEKNIILYQKIFGQNTNKPILTHSNVNGQNITLFQAENWWRWRMENYNLFENFDLFDQFYQDVFRLTNIQHIKDPIQVKFPKKIFLNEEHRMDIQLFNKLYQNLTNIDVEFSISFNGKEIQNSTLIAQGKVYSKNLSFKEEGQYQYSIRTKIDGKEEVKSGIFFVEKNEIETQDTRARFDVLRGISNRSNGKFYVAKDVQKLLNNLESKPVNKQVFSQEEEKTILDNIWYLIVLLSLCCIEWFVRRKVRLQ